MGGIYGKLMITAYILFAAILSGFIIMCVVLGKRREKASDSKE